MKYTSALSVCVLGMALQSYALDLPVNLFPTGNSNPDLASQLSITVDEDSGQAVFMISNSGGDGTVKEVQFYDGSLLGISSISGSSGVSFSQTTTKRADKQDKFPSANFGVTFSGAGGASNGVDGGENLSVAFDLKNGQTFADLINELNNGTVYLKLHVIRIGEDNEGSDWYVSTPPPSDTPSVPDGGVTLALLGCSLLGLGLLRKRVGS